MGSINVDYIIKTGCVHKGEILGFTKTGMAVFANSLGLNALDTCECCGTIIHGQLIDADFCPVCAVILGLVSENIAREYCLERYIIKFNEMENDFNHKVNHYSLIEGFKAGIKYGVKNAYVGIKVNWE